MGAVALLVAAAVSAARIQYLARDEMLCDAGRDTCIRGTLRYESNERLLWLSGRVQSAPGPGLLTIILKGATRQGFIRYAPMEIELRGRTSEIVDFRMIPDHPDVYDWQIDRITFEPEADE